MAAGAEIDVEAPFDSVKAAIKKFGLTAVSNQSSPFRTNSSKRLICNEHQLYLTRKKLDDIKRRIESAKRIKAEAVTDIEWEKQTIQDVKKRLKAAAHGKQEAIQAKADANRRAPELSRQLLEVRARKRQVDVAREEAKASIAELNDAKHELEKIRLDFDAGLEEMTKAYQKAAEAHHHTKLRSDEANKVLIKIVAMKEALLQLRSRSERTEEQEKELEEEHNARREAYRFEKDEFDGKLTALRREYLQAVLVAEAANVDVDALEAEIEELHKWKAARDKLHEALSALQQLTEGQQSLRKLVSVLTWELLNQLQLKTENLNRESEEMERSIKEVKQKAERSRATEEETRRKLEVVLREAEKAKAAKMVAFDKVRAIHRWHAWLQGKVEMG